MTPARLRSLLAVGAVLLLECATGPAAGASGAADPDNMLTYEPYGLVHNLHTAAEVDGYLDDLPTYGIGQALLQTPRFAPDGDFRLPRHDATMLARWARRAAAYNASHGTTITVTAVFNGEVKAGDGDGLDLDDSDVRARMVAGIESVLATGVGAVNFDLEPFPMTAGYLDLLRETNGMFARAGFAGRLSVVASGFTSKWTPSYLKRVSRQVSQIDPMYYDSEFKTAAAYEAWMVDSLAYYSDHARTGTKIVPVLPSYSANPWHRPAVENIVSATSALSDALADGSRVDGAGIWWWWGFFYDEDGAYDAGGDRSAWLSTTINLPFSR